MSCTFGIQYSQFHPTSALRFQPQLSMFFEKVKVEVAFNENLCQCTMLQWAGPLAKPKAEAHGKYKLAGQLGANNDSSQLCKKSRARGMAVGAGNTNGDRAPDADSTSHLARGT